ncbi:DUF3592 domain-containing protein [Thiorhodovibrio litoralis]|uniref:DUF3592 domain-containing protein n=1 Tax=Thiorhodovibrio litoralis TaxID=2952932 RepID=UPI002B264577|nr:DUF3592 domain-containing protein [Thiorhodovibrio litoralis]WPL13114.1 hypothetical protein Thiosp_02906 [Thiorhodovibrio litoralis]
MAPPSTPGKPWREIFAYEYQVDGKTYSADRYSFENVGGDRSVGIQRYDPGDRVTVYYNPEKPSTAVLEKKNPGFFVVVVLVFGIAFLLASIGSLLARDSMALLRWGGRGKVWRQLASRREQPAKLAVDESFARKSPNAHGASPLSRMNPLSRGNSKHDRPNHETVPWYSYLAEPEQTICGNRPRF